MGASLATQTVTSAEPRRLRIKLCSSSALQQHSENLGVHMIFWLGLFAGLIIGWVVEWIIDWRFWRQEQNVSVDEESRLRRELEAARLEISRLQTQVSAPPAPGALAPVSASVNTPGRPDHLQDVNGIGQVYAKRLNDAGVYTFAQLSELSPDRLREIIQPQEWQSLDFASWITQARTFAQKAQKGS
jgi:predicted flap endonuclease-1-like 5' DNA nuclease